MQPLRRLQETPLAHVLRSSVVRKAAMALSGVILFLFVLGHMAGNLQIFLGPDVINGYAKLLKSKGGLLWAARGGLLATLVVHVVTSLLLARENRNARPVSYLNARPFGVRYASRSMVLSGLIIVAFVVYHLMHFTFGMTDPHFLALRDTQNRHDVYRMMILGFSNPGVSLFYIGSMGLLCLHLSHGVSAMFFSLGMRQAQFSAMIDRLARGAAWLVFIGNSSIPLAVLFGWVK